MSTTKEEGDHVAVAEEGDHIAVTEVVDSV